MLSQEDEVVVDKVVEGYAQGTRRKKDPVQLKQTTDQDYRTGIRHLLAELGIGRADYLQGTGHSLGQVAEKQRG